MRTTYVDMDEPRQDRLSLVWLILGLGVTGVFLYKVLGLPHLPATWPTWDGVVTTLKGSELPLDGVLYFLTILGWLLWGWLAFSLALELLVVGAEALSRGAAWAAGLRAAADHLTAPFVRRVVDGAVVAAVVVNLVGRSATPAAAAPLDETPIVLYHEAPPDAAPPPQPQAPDEASAEVTYTVQAGDSLWAIAERFYGDGDAFPRLIVANVGRAQPGGQRFRPQGIIHPGWTLVVPEPVPNHVVEREQVVYVVVAGDTLWDIAARRLGDPLRWPEIFDLNRGVARHPQYGWTLTNPDLIWPGLPLLLPVDVASPAVEPPLAAEKADAPLPVGGMLPETSVPSAPRPPAPKPVVTKTSAPTPQAPTMPAPTPARIVTPAPLARDEGLPPIVWGAAGLMTAATLGAAGVVARRRFRRSLAEPPVVHPEDVMPPRGDFLDAEFARLLQHRLHSGEVEAVVLVAEHTLRFLAEQGFKDVTLVSASQDRQSVALTLTTPLLDQARLVEVGPRLAERLGGEVDTGTTYDGDVLLRVHQPKLAGLVGGRTASALSRLVAVGLAPPRRAVYLNWPAVGHVLVAGLPDGGVETTLTSLVCALAARSRPEALHVYTVASRRALPPQLFQLPHQIESAEPTDSVAVEALLERLQAEALRRMNASSSSGEAEDLPQLVLLVHDLAELQDSPALETISIHGPAQGVQILAGSTQLETVSDATLAVFPTRVALQMVDEDLSIRLLSDTVPADLGRGRLMVRIDGRWPLELQGFRVSAERLDELLTVMGDAYGRGEIGKRDAVEDVEADPEPDGTSGGDGIPRGEADEPEDMVEDEHGLIEEDEAVAPLAAPGDALEDELPTAYLDSDLDAAPSPNGAAPGPIQDAALQQPLVRIECFGDFVVHRGSEQLGPYVEGRYAHKSWELLAYLASHPPQGVDVDRLIADLWPDASSSSRQPLNMAAHRARLLLAGKAGGEGAKAVRIDRQGLARLDRSLVVSDVHSFLTLIAQANKGDWVEAKAALEKAVALYRADLLSAPGVPTYPWVDQRGDNGLTLRETYHLEYMAAVKRLARLYREDGDAQLAVPLLRGLLQQEPLLEDVVRELYRCYEQLGDLGALLREDRRLRHALYTAYYDPHNPDDDPGLYPPEAETVAAFEEVRRALDKMKEFDAG